MNTQDTTAGLEQVVLIRKGHGYVKAEPTIGQPLEYTDYESMALRHNRAGIPSLLRTWVDQEQRHEYEILADNLLDLCEECHEWTAQMGCSMCVNCDPGGDGSGQGSRGADY